MADDKSETGLVFRGPDHASPYPVSRLAPAYDLVDLARQIQQADEAIEHSVNAKLDVIAAQIRHLQEQARQTLEAARDNAMLHRAVCDFQKRVGHVYYLYDQGDRPHFSMLSPADWSGKPPYPYLGKYRLEIDRSWTRIEGDEADHPSPPRITVREVLAAKPPSSADVLRLKSGES